MNTLLNVSEAAELIGVHPETLRRWDRESKLVAIKINDRGDRRYKKKDLIKFISNNSELIQYSQIVDYNDYSIRWDSEGFMSMTGNFGLIGKIIAKQKGKTLGFAFATAGTALLERGNKKERLDQVALDKVKEYLDKKKPYDGNVYTFKYSNGGFYEVENPDWWKGKYSKPLVSGLRVEAQAAHPTTMKNQAWRVILAFKVKEEGHWVTNSFGPDRKFYQYFVWIDSRELIKKGLPNSSRGAEIMAINYCTERFEKTKNNKWDRDITRIKENNATRFDGKWLKGSKLPKELMDN